MLDCRELSSFVKGVFVISFFLIFSVFVFAGGTYSGVGDGSAEAPYRISTAAHMQQIGANHDDWDKHFVLTNNVSLAEYTGNSYNVIGVNVDYFTGSFNGCGYEIEGFTYTSSDGTGAGLFGFIGLGGEIRNLAVKNANIDIGEGSAAGCLAVVNDGYIFNCHSTGSVKGAGSIGGLVGYNSIDGIISNCSANCSSTATGVFGAVGGLTSQNYGVISSSHSSGSVVGTDGAGGLAADNYEGSLVVYSYSDCTVSGGLITGGLLGQNMGHVYKCHSSGTVYGANYVGGLIGYNMSDLSDCYSTGHVECGSGGGGLLGCNTGDITDCYSTAFVCKSKLNGMASDFVFGGLIGVNDGNVTKCYSKGDVVADGDLYGWGSYVGGLIGNNFGDITECHASGFVNAYSYVGGLIGMNVGAVLECYASGEVVGHGGVGGLIAHNSSSVSKSFATGNVKAVGERGWNAAGLVGVNCGAITACYATGSAEGFYYVGGLAGNNVARSGDYGTITDCYATGNALGVWLTGGLAGGNEGSILNSYSCGRATGSDSGGLVGSNHEDGIVLNCFWDTVSSGSASSAGGTGLTTDAMMTQEVYSGVGWDFEELWCINEGRDYPKLYFQRRGDVDNDGHINLGDLAVMVGTWELGIGEKDYSSMCDFSGDDYIGWDDLKVLAEAWLEGPKW